MTTEERFAQLEHYMAGLSEERRRDREEYRQLWRDTQRQLNDLALKTNELTLKVADTNDAVNRYIDESRQSDQRLAERIEAVDQRLGQRIEALVSAIGEYIRESRSQSKA